jgi:hypothetical protein
MVGYLFKPIRPAICFDTDRTFLQFLVKPT